MHFISFNFCSPFTGRFSNVSKWAPHPFCGKLDVYIKTYPPIQAHTGPYSLLNITATTSLTKGQPWQPGRSTYVGQPSITDSPSSSSGDGPHVATIIVLSPLVPTGHLLGPRTILEIQGPQFPTCSRLHCNETPAPHCMTRNSQYPPLGADIYPPLI